MQDTKPNLGGVVGNSDDIFVYMGQLHPIVLNTEHSLPYPKQMMLEEGLPSSLRRRIVSQPEAD
ncbi:MAG: uncharacterized protein KVP18_003362 [Porospora cf. gigantea A]|uniref:uncharacterized protein n=1 Tax=Porospora cf. gigantea A TaxID=2853593 RepID=UPI003559B026|nr:MAG: hypothetical protein KVP18_003362 [Porospora cf. gigantea A]